MKGRHRMSPERVAQWTVARRHQDMQHRFTHGPAELPDVVVQGYIRFNQSRATPRGWARFLRAWRRRMRQYDAAPWRRGTWA